MFRIRQVPDAVTPANATAVAQVQEMLSAQLAGISAAEVAAIPAKLHDPLKYGFRYMLFVAEQGGRVRGFALLSWAPDHKFCYLDYIVSAPGRSGGGIGGALYARVREHAAALGAVGLFYETLPDDPALSPEPPIRRQNMARLRFYERYGARPIIGTRYETPLQPGETNPPYLTYDGLGRETPPGRDEARRIVRAILERKYGSRCPPGYIDMVVESFTDDPIRSVRRSPRRPGRSRWWSTTGTTSTMCTSAAMSRRRCAYVPSSARSSRWACSTGSSRTASPTGTSAPYTTRASSTISTGRAPLSATASRSTRTSSRSATPRGRRRNSACARATGASTPSRRSTAMPISPPGTASTAR
jgi:GNAT superfamily N-acetyltransferase